jgi:hypothetical protein
MSSPTGMRESPDFPTRPLPGREDSNLRIQVLETCAVATEPLPKCAALGSRRLLNPVPLTRCLKPPSRLTGRRGDQSRAGYSGLARGRIDIAGQANPGHPATGQQRDAAWIVEVFGFVLIRCTVDEPRAGST